MKKNPLRLFGTFVVLLIFLGALWLLKKQLTENHIDLAKIVGSLKEVPASRLVAAVLITVLNYGVLVFYDLLAVRYIGEKLALWRVSLASFAGYAFSYNFGATLFGTTIRYRLYSAWGVSIVKILQLLVILGLTFWFGVFFLSGLIFVFAPLQIPEAQIQQIAASANLSEKLQWWFRLIFTDSRPFGIILLILAGLYLGTAALHRGSLKIFRWQLPVPPFKLSVYQIAVASADMLVAGLVLWVLFPAVKGGYLTVLAVYLVAYVLVVLSHVPGGWGVLEAVILSLLKVLNLIDQDEIPHVLAALVIFRLVYFLGPLLLAASMLGAHEVALRKGWLHEDDQRHDHESQPSQATEVNVGE